MSDFEVWRKEATPEFVEVSVCFDRALVSELDAINDQRTKRKGMLDDGAGDRARDLAKQVEAKTRTFRFVSIGKQRWRELLGEHPPSEEDRKKYGADHDPETFPPVAIAASCAEPTITEDQARWLLFEAEFPLSVTERIWGACLRANVEGVDEKKVLAIASPRAGEKK